MYYSEQGLRYPTGGSLAGRDDYYEKTLVICTEKAPCNNIPPGEAAGRPAQQDEGTTVCPECYSTVDGIVLYKGANTRCFDRKGLFVFLCAIQCHDK